MGKIVAISGGNLQSTDNLNRYAIHLTGKDHPSVLFIPTADCDAEGYIENIEKYYGSLGCPVTSLCLYTRTYTIEELEAIFAEADLIYVGGGDTHNMLLKWREHGVDKPVLQAHERGKVMTGISAGAICWFACGHSDSEYFTNPDHWQYSFVDGLDVFHAAFCPHYNEEGRDSFDEMAADNITADPQAYRLEYGDEVLQKILLQDEECLTL